MKCPMSKYFLYNAPFCGRNNIAIGCNNVTRTIANPMILCIDIVIVPSSVTIIIKPIIVHRMTKNIQETCICFGENLKTEWRLDMFVYTDMEI